MIVQVYVSDAKYFCNQPESNIAHKMLTFYAHSMFHLNIQNCDINNAIRHMIHDNYSVRIGNRCIPL